MKLFTLIALAFTLWGCAVGNKYNYESADINLPVKGTAAVAVDVDDARSYVISGDKKSNFVGLQRGGFGNPFNVTTESDKPLADVITEVLVAALKNGGYTSESIELNNLNVAAIQTALATTSDKLVYLKVIEWKTDIYSSITLHYNLELTVYNKEGEAIASSSQKGSEVIGGGGFSSSNSAAAVSALQQKISFLFNSEEIKHALDSGV